MDRFPGRGWGVVAMDTGVDTSRPVSTTFAQFERR